MLLLPPSPGTRNSSYSLCSGSDICHGTFGGLSESVAAISVAKGHLRDAAAICGAGGAMLDDVVALCDVGGELYSSSRRRSEPVAVEALSLARLGELGTGGKEECRGVGIFAVAARSELDGGLLDGVASSCSLLGVLSSSFCPGPHTVPRRRFSLILSKACLRSVSCTG